MDAGPQDEAEYSCKAVNSEGEAEHSAELIVIQPGVWRHRIRQMRRTTHELCTVCCGPPPPSCTSFYSEFYKAMRVLRRSVLLCCFRCRCLHGSVSSQVAVRMRMKFGETQCKFARPLRTKHCRWSSSVFGKMYRNKGFGPCSACNRGLAFQHLRRDYDATNAVLSRQLQLRSSYLPLEVFLPRFNKGSKKSPNDETETSNSNIFFGNAYIPLVHLFDFWQKRFFLNSKRNRTERFCLSDDSFTKRLQTFNCVHLDDFVQSVENRCAKSKPRNVLRGW